MAPFEGVVAGLVEVGIMYHCILDTFFKAPTPPHCHVRVASTNMLVHQAPRAGPGDQGLVWYSDLMPSGPMASSVQHQDRTSLSED